MRYIVLCSVFLTAGIAQTQPNTPHFDVVSVKPCKSGMQNRTNVSPGRLTFECVTLDALIRGAYVSFADGIGPPSRTLQALRSQKIKGSSGWIGSDRFTINAKADAIASSVMMQGPMIRPVLEDRFKLKIHREVREIPIYELVVTGPTRFVPSKPGTCVEWDPLNGRPPGREKGQAAPPVICGNVGYQRNNRLGGLDILSAELLDVCVLFTVSAERDVIDKTHLTGRFDLHLDGLTFEDVFPRPNANPGEAPADPVSALNSALRKLGLKLQSAKMQADFLVIDHAEKPSEN